MPKPGEAKKPAPASKPAAAAAFLLPKSPARCSAQAQDREVLYNKQTIGGVDLDVALQGATPETQSGRSLIGRARLQCVERSEISDRPVGPTSLSISTRRTSTVLTIFGCSPTGLGKVNGGGGVCGNAEQASVRELTVSSGGDTVKMTGVVSTPGGASGTLSAVGYKGSLSINNETSECAVEVKVKDRTMITVDLKAASLDLDRLQTRGAAPARPAAPARGQPAASAAGKPIDTAAMRSVDASVKLVAGTLISAPLRINNADLVLSLKDGVLTVEHFKGALYGGALALSGTIDGSKPALAIAFKGDASNISIGEMLRGMNGSNQFGSAVKVTIDGQLSANGITLNGGGSTSEQIKSSLAGGAQLGGHLLVGADKALTMIGSAAAGAVGASSTIRWHSDGRGRPEGRRRRRKHAERDFARLNRFVNHDSPISGRVDIAGGVLTDKSLVVQGDRAAANISTRTNLAASTTDTTINFTIAEDGSAPYLITTARGPLSSPSLNVTRGTAKDPPGMINTLTNAIPGVGGGGGTSSLPSIIPKIPIPSLFGR